MHLQKVRTGDHGDPPEITPIASTTWSHTCLVTGNFYTDRVGSSDRKIDPLGARD